MLEAFRRLMKKFKKKAPPPSFIFNEELEREIAIRIPKSNLFLAEKRKIHELYLKELSPQLYNILQSNTAENNLLVISLLQGQLGWDESKALNLVLLEVLNHKKNIHIQAPKNPNRRCSIFFGDLELSFFMFAYDEGDVHEIVYEIELDVLLKKGTKELKELNYPACNLLGDTITEEIFIGFILENTPAFMPHILKEI